MDDEKAIQLMSILDIDMETAQYYLEMTEQDVQKAIDIHMNTGTSSLSQPLIEEQVRAPIPDQMDTLVGHSEEEPTYIPIQYNDDSETDDFESTLPPFMNPALPHRSHQPIPNISQATSSTSSAFTELFRPPLDMLFKGSFEECRNHATQVERWMVVNIQKTDEFSCLELNRDIWRNDAIQDVIGACYIFWQEYLPSEEAQTVVNNYQITTYPTILLIDPNSLECIHRLEGKLTLETVMDTLAQFMEFNNVPPTVHEDIPAIEMPQEPSEDHPDGCTILFRLPDGSKIQRRFFKDHGVHALYAFLRASDIAIPSQFTLFTTYPKRALPNNPHDPQSIDSLGLFPRAMVVVEEE